MSCIIIYINTHVTFQFIRVSYAITITCIHSLILFSYNNTRGAIQWYDTLRRACFIRRNTANRESIPEIIIHTSTYCHPTMWHLNIVTAIVRFLHCITLYKPRLWNSSHQMSVMVHFLPTGASTYTTCLSRLAQFCSLIPTSNPYWHLQNHHRFTRMRHGSSFLSNRVLHWNLLIPHPMEQFTINTLFHTQPPISIPILPNISRIMMISHF